MVSTIKQHAGAGLVAAAVIVASIAHGLFDPTGYAAGSVLVWAAVTAGLAGRAIPLRRMGGLTAVAAICLAGIAVLAFLSVNWASDQGRAFEEAVRASFYAGLFVLAACTASRRGRDEWVAGLTIGLAVVSVVALFAYLQPGTLGGRSDIPGAAGRLSYPVGYWNGAAALLATATVLLAHAGAASSARRLRIGATALIPLSVLAIWLTDSRGGALAAVVALVALVAASPIRSRQLVAIGIGLAGAAVLVAASESMHALTRDVADSASRADGDRMSAISVVVVGLTAFAASRFGGARPDLRVSRRARLAIGLIAALAIVAGLLATHPARRFDEFKAPPPTENGVAAGGAELSSNGRWQFWSSAVDAFESEPLRGVGAGGFESWWGVHGDVPLFVRNPHSLPLQAAVDLGVPGIALFAGFCAALAVCCRRRLSARQATDTDVLLAVFIAGASGALFDWTWEIPAVFAPAVVCSGLIISSAPSLRELRGRLWGGLAILAACAGVVVGGVVVLSEQNLRLSREAASDGRIDEAISRAKAARSIEPWSADPYTQLALLERERGDISAALGYVRQAEERDSEDWRLPVIEATLLQRSGDFSSARTAYLRAGRLSPLPVKSIVFAPASQG
jgi:hypothetical protein